jgi:hypothetical protein
VVRFAFSTLWLLQSPHLLLLALPPRFSHLCIDVGVAQLGGTAQMLPHYRPARPDDAVTCNIVIMEVTAPDSLHHAQSRSLQNGHASDSSSVACPLAAAPMRDLSLTRGWLVLSPARAGFPGTDPPAALGRLPRPVVRSSATAAPCATR